MTDNSRRWPLRLCRPSLSLLSEMRTESRHYFRLSPQSALLTFFTLTELLELIENVLVVTRRFNLLDFDIRDLAVFVHDDGRALAAVQRLEVQSVLLDYFS